MTETTIWRVRAVIFFCVGGLAGLLLFSMAEPQLAAAVLLGCTIPLIWFMMNVAKSRTHMVKGGGPFAAEVVVELRLSERLGSGERQRIFAVGHNGFTARFILPAASTGGLSVVAMRAEAQFLRPELALQHFAAGTSFSVVEKQRIVGSGEVIEVLRKSA